MVVYQLENNISDEIKLVESKGVEKNKEKKNNTNIFSTNNSEEAGYDEVEVSEQKGNDFQKIWNSIDEAEKKAVEGKDLLEIDKITKKPRYVIVKAGDGKYHIYKDGKSVIETDYGNNRIYNFKYEKIKGEDIEVEVNLFSKVLNKIFKKIKIKVKIEKKGFYLADGITYSPLVIDYNEDGKVSAQGGIGVDIDGDGKADGAAVDGDKMLAMSDINGNNEIDGEEVFGNMTRNPYTGELINAKNGFEALKEIAKIAEKQSGIDCIDDNEQNVNLENLKRALNKKGINLGFISGRNNKKLEELSKIKEINVSEYEETPEQGIIQHNQKGYGITKDGSKVKVDDVWFVRNT